MPAAKRFSGLAALLLVTLLQARAQERRVLVYTRNEIGSNLYVHANIPASVAAIKQLGMTNDIAVEVTDG